MPSTEIKLRAFDKATGKIYEVSCVELSGGTADAVDVHTLGMPLWSGMQLFRSDVNLLRYSGYKDRKREEIYEGDVLTSEKWSPNRMQVTFIYGKFLLMSGDGTDVMDINDAGVERAEVLGSIYRAPDLLTEGRGPGGPPTR